MTADLAAFLRARLDERQRAIQLGGRVIYDPGPHLEDEAIHLIWDRDEALADIDAKRRIIDLYSPRSVFGTLVCRTCDQARDPIGQWTENPSWLCPTLQLLALPWRDHPDYRAEEWTP